MTVSDSPLARPPAAAVEPFFFGQARGQIFGCYHEPATWPMREVGIVLCSPYGQEMIRSHRASHHLAVEMARSGFPVLRFDFVGTGDSAGDGTEATLEEWRANIALAVDALRVRAGVGPVLLAGLRLGGTLALMAAPGLADVAGLILWEPVISGPRYLEELHRLHGEAIDRFFVRPRDYVASAQPAEVLGFPMPDGLRTGIARVDLLDTPLLRQRPLLVIESQGASEMAALAARLQEGAPLTHAIVPSFSVWLDDVDKGLVPHPLIEAVIQWLETTFP